MLEDACLYIYICIRLIFVAYTLHFVIAGLNSIVLYLGHQTAWQMLPFNFALSDGMETHWKRLPESLWGVACWLLVAYEMHRRKVYITVS